MIETKVSLTIMLQGSVMFSKDECLKTTQKTVEVKNKKTGKVYKKTVKTLVDNLDMMDKHTVRVSEKKDGKLVHETYVYYTRKSRPASQHINISKESYNAMISSECPSWCKKKVWENMSKNQRLHAHLQRICDSLNGTSYHVEILDD